MVDSVLPWMQPTLVRTSRRRHRVATDCLRKRMDCARDGRARVRVLRQARVKRPA